MLKNNRIILSLFPIIKPLYLYLKEPSLYTEEHLFHTQLSYIWDEVLQASG